MLELKPRLEMVPAGEGVEGRCTLPSRGPVLGVDLPGILVL